MDTVEIKNKIINTEEDIDNEDVLKLNILLNSIQSFKICILNIHI